jgi:hypothetical protein
MPTSETRDLIDLSFQIHLEQEEFPGWSLAKTMLIGCGQEF